MNKNGRDEKRRKETEEQSFKNEFVENSLRSNAGLKQQPPTGVHESYESTKEPNGIDPETIFEKGYTFQETTEEARSQRMNRLGEEPNSINPPKK